LKIYYQHQEIAVYINKFEHFAFLACYFGRRYQPKYIPNYGIIRAHPTLFLFHLDRLIFMRKRETKRRKTTRSVVYFLVGIYVYS